jgi:hypothetical protein
LTEGNVDFIPHFIEAKSPVILRRLMLLNNAKHGIMFAYFDIQFAEGKWYCWYNLPFNMGEILGAE